jgi:hypothetical protein
MKGRKTRREFHPLYSQITNILKKMNNESVDYRIALVLLFGFRKIPRIDRRMIPPIMTTPHRKSFSNRMAKVMKMICGDGPSLYFS